MKKQVKNKTVILVNPLNSETWACEDFTKTKDIDGIPYVTVYKPENNKRTFLMRKDALRLSKSYS
jgi:hypothetical protein